MATSAVRPPSSGWAGHSRRPVRIGWTGPAGGGTDQRRSRRCGQLGAGDPTVLEDQPPRNGISGPRHVACVRLLVEPRRQRRSGRFDAGAEGTDRRDLNGVAGLGAHGGPAGVGHLGVEHPERRGDARSANSRSRAPMNGSIGARGSVRTGTGSARRTEASRSAPAGVTDPRSSVIEPRKARVSASVTSVGAAASTSTRRRRAGAEHRVRQNAGPGADAEHVDLVIPVQLRLPGVGACRILHQEPYPPVIVASDARWAECSSLWSR